jgi:hypothetical protein
MLKPSGRKLWSELLETEKDQIESPGIRTDIRRTEAG